MAGTATIDPYARSSRRDLDDLYTIPIHSSWFSWDEIHETERVALKEFFDLSSISRTPKIYKEYRDFIINKYREDPSGRLAFTQVRKSLVGDVTLLHKVFLFLEKWGLINFGATDYGAVKAVGDTELKHHKVDVEEGVPNGIRVVAVPNSGRPLSAPTTTKRTGGPSREVSGIPPLASFSDVFRDAMQHKALACRNCSAICYSGCYESTKEEGFVICINCLKNENLGENKSKDDFRFSDCKGSDGNHGAEWTEAETLLLLESVLKHGDDWELVAQIIGNKSKLDCILKLIELPFGEFMFGSAYRAGKNDDPDGNVNKQLQRPLARSPEIIESDDQHKKTEKTEEIQNGDSGDSANQEPPLKRKRVNALPSGGVSLMKQAALMSATVSPDIAAASAETAVTAICNETSCSREIFDGQEVFTGNDSRALAGLHSGTVVGDFSMKDELSQAAEAPEVPASKTVIPLRMRAATAAALGAAAAHAKLLADQEDREIEHLVASVIETQMKKVQYKMKHFEDLELIMEKEFAEMENLKEAITSERLHVLERALRAGISRWMDHPSLKC
ncbi:SWI/SNF complex subunit SWI3A isoform X1 [Punica granatum]|uniref:SWI/SNF complex subunit SWI3A isoform X1 n=1 Tax=Punica granatum TaxID=22663 RepID=A0A6P8E9P8_PUNGR|nr:SWI/SNF complex subunit SWI3A isoform X1 [Punica granatum]